MSWVLVISEEDDFHREAIALVGGAHPVVGATGDSSACGLVRAVDVGVIIVDGGCDLGRRFLAIIGNLPRRARPRTVVIGTPESAPLFVTMPSLRVALPARAA